MLKRTRVAIAASFSLLVLMIVLAGVAYSLHDTHASASSSTNTNTPLPSSSQVQTLVNLVQQNPTFISAENGTTYQFTSYAGLGVNYRNGTQIAGTLILYFDNCAPGNQCGMVNGPFIYSELQVYTTMTGQILSIHPITDSTLLNANYGLPPIPPN
jgi:hypothetical protein